MIYKNGYRVVSSKYNKKLQKSYGYRVDLSKKKKLNVTKTATWNNTSRGIKRENVRKRKNVKNNQLSTVST